MAIYILNESENSDNNQNVTSDEQPKDGITDESYISEDEARSIMESIDFKDSYTGLFEANANTLDIDNAIFELMLNLDIMSAVNNNIGYVEEAEVTSANNNAKKATLSSHTGQIINNSKQAIKQTGAKANDEALTLLTSDKKTYKKYVSALRTYKNLDGFVGISNFSFPNEKCSRYIDMVGDMSDITRAYRKAVSSILDAKSKAKISSVIEQFSTDISIVMSDCNDRSRKAFQKENKWNPSRQDVMLLVKFINNPSKIICSISEEIRNCNEQLNKINKIANNAYTLCDNKSVELYTTMMNAIYQCSSLAARTCVQKFNSFKDLTIREIAAYRKAAMICGRYALKSKEGVNESVEMQNLSAIAIGESSDEYVFERFENL